MEGRSTHHHDPTVVDDMDIETQIKNKNFQEKFRIPKDEFLLKGFQIKINKNNKKKNINVN